jgi:hypothetical protein
VEHKLAQEALRPAPKAKDAKLRRLANIAELLLDLMTTDE